MKLTQLLALGSALNVPPELNFTINYTGPTTVTAEFEVTNALKADAFATSQLFVRPTGILTLVSSQGFFGPPSGVSTETINNQWYAGAEGEPYNPEIGFNYEVRITQLTNSKTVEVAGGFPALNPPLLNTWQIIDATRGWQLLVRGSENGGSFYSNLQVEFRKITDHADYKLYNFYLASSVFIT